MTWRRLFRSGRADRGGALVELAIALPLLVLIMAAAIDYARIFYMAMALTNAARAGAQYGANTVGQSQNYTAMENAATTATNLSGVTANASRLCQCATDAGVFSPTASANDCASPEATACPSGHRVITVTVWTHATFTTLMWNFPAIASTTSISRAATLRVAQ
jgi:Flp pilus assembly protein TadG